MSERARQRGARTPQRPSEQNPLGDVGGEVKSTLGRWLQSPALDFYAIAVIGGILITVGLVMVLSSSSVTNIAKGHSPYASFMTQGAFAVIGLVLLIAATLTPVRWYKNIGVATLLLALGLFLQALVFTPLGLGKGGNRNWIHIGPIRGQPSEFLKLALAVWLGAFLSKNRDRLRELPVFATAIAGTGAALGLIILGRDLGTMMMVGILAAGAFWVAGVPKRWFLIAGGGAAALVIGLVLASPNRMARALNWLHGECAGDSCYQADNGLMALATGGWWGVGIGQSRQKWGRVPEADNDFIFSIIGEELGLFGTLLIVVLFTLLALVLYRMMVRLRDPFVQITIAGITSWILAQAFVNMAVVTGLLPVLGVPLPFVSAGGSALIASMLALGVLLAFAKSEPGAAEALRAHANYSKKSATVVAKPASETRATKGSRS